MTSSKNSEGNQKSFDQTCVLEVVKFKNSRHMANLWRIRRTETKTRSLLAEVAVVRLVDTFLLSWTPWVYTFRSILWSSSVELFWIMAERGCFRARLMSWSWWLWRSLATVLLLARHTMRQSLCSKWCVDKSELLLGCRTLMPRSLAHTSTSFPPPSSLITHHVYGSWIGGGKPRDIQFFQQKVDNMPEMVNVRTSTVRHDSRLSLPGTVQYWESTTNDGNGLSCFRY